MAESLLNNDSEVTQCRLKSPNGSAPQLVTDPLSDGTLANTWTCHPLQLNISPLLGSLVQIDTE